jgi:hypothetical protein
MLSAIMFYVILLSVAVLSGSMKAVMNSISEEGLTGKSWIIHLTWLFWLYFQMNASTFCHSKCRKSVGEHHNTQHDDTQHNNKTRHSILTLDA